MSENKTIVYLDEANVAIRQFPDGAMVLLPNGAVMDAQTYWDDFNFGADCQLELGPNSWTRSDGVRVPILGYILRAQQSAGVFLSRENYESYLES